MKQYEKSGNGSLKVSETVSVFMNRVYMWMTVGLAITGVTAWYISQSPQMQSMIQGNKLVFLGLLIAELITVFVLILMINQLSAGGATSLFILYSLLTGATFSVIFIVYPMGAISNAFFTTAGMFLVMSIYGTVTKRDLTGLGQFLIMGLIGIIIAGIVNLFLKSDKVDFVISCIGVIVFTGLTAYDTQKIRKIGMGLTDSAESVNLKKQAILGALTLYLDFINLFLELLKLFGRKK